MKVYAFGTRQDEVNGFGKLAADYGQDITLETTSFNKDFWQDIKGYDAISTVGNCSLGREAIETLAKEGVKIIAQRAAGTNNIDLDACKELGITVTNVPAYSPTSVSEFTVGMAINMTRNIPLALDRAQHQNFSIEMPLLGREIQNMTVGVVGSGRIGFSVIKAFSGLTENILAYDVFQNPEVEKYATYVELEELLEKSDIITLHCPLFDDNYHMINKDSIAKMKDGVYIINAARGGLIDAEALIDGILSNKIAACALDTYEHEAGIFFVNHTGEKLQDPVLARLMQLPNVYITPHYGFYTDIAVENIIADVLTSLKDLEEKGTCEHKVV